ncbi:MAG: hypothetical protein IJL91_11475 [Bacteroidales bacterium]|nr:hypothetical protein [Bacteroidales bacterium]
MITPSQTTSKRIQTAFRLDSDIIDKLKEAARLAGKSLNEFVNSILSKSVQDLTTEKEKEADKLKTNAFLDTFAGKWSDDRTSEQIMDDIRSGNIISEIKTL